MRPRKQAPREYRVSWDNKPTAGTLANRESLPSGNKDNNSLVAVNLLCFIPCRKSGHKVQAGTTKNRKIIPVERSLGVRKVGSSPHGLAIPMVLTMVSVASLFDAQHYGDKTWNVLGSSVSVSCIPPSPI